LADKLREERVQRVIEPILYAEEKPKNILDDDILYVRDLGIISLNDLEISNPIYAEIIPRQLTFSTQKTIHHQSEWYVSDSGTLDISK